MRETHPPQITVVTDVIDLKWISKHMTYTKVILFAGPVVSGQTKLPIPSTNLIFNFLKQRYELL